MALQLRGVHPIVLTISDATQSANFYERILGVKAFSGSNQVGCISGWSTWFWKNNNG